MRVLRLLPLLLVALLAASCGGAEHKPQAPTVTLAVAASAAPALTELASTYSATHATRVIVTQGATGTLAAQIRNGAPIDALYAADMESVRKLADEGAIDPATVREYARGKLVLWQPAGAAPRLGSVAELRAGTHRVAIANPDTAPYGRAAVEVLRKSGWTDEDLDSLIRAENVGQALQFAKSGNVDAAFVALSNLKSDDPAGITVAKDDYSPIVQGCGIVRHSKLAADAALFDAWVASPEGAAILARHHLR